MRHHPSGGFSLPEVLVAVTVLAVGILAVAGLVSASGERTRTAARRADLVIAAQQALESAARLPFDSLGSTIDTTPAPGSFIRDRSVSAIGPNLKRLDLTVFDSGALPPVRLTLIVARPTWLP